MSEHVTEWVGAYQDGELRGARLRQVGRNGVALQPRQQLALAHLVAHLHAHLDDAPTSAHVSRVRLASDTSTTCGAAPASTSACATTGASSRPRAASGRSKSSPVSLSTAALA